MEESLIATTNQCSKAVNKVKPNQKIISHVTESICGNNVLTILMENNFDPEILAVAAVDMIKEFEDTFASMQTKDFFIEHEDEDPFIQMVVVKMDIAEVENNLRVNTIIKVYLHLHMIIITIKFQLMEFHLDMKHII